VVSEQEAESKGFQSSFNRSTDSAVISDFDGDGRNDIVSAQYLLEGIMITVADADAKALNGRLDGANLGEMGTSGQDFKGRVTYHKAGSNPLEVHIYITHY
jgi:hypothetical protein